MTWMEIEMRPKGTTERASGFGSDRLESASARSELGQQRPVTQWWISDCFSSCSLDASAFLDTASIIKWSKLEKPCITRGRQKGQNLGKLRSSPAQLGLRRAPRLVLQLGPPLGDSEASRRVIKFFDETLKESVSRVSVPFLEATRQHNRQVLVRVARQRIHTTSIGSLSKDSRGPRAISSSEDAEASPLNWSVPEHVFGRHVSSLGFALLVALPLAFMIRGSMRKRKRSKPIVQRVSMMSSDQHLVTEPVKIFHGAFASDARSGDSHSDVNVKTLEHDTSAREAVEAATGIETRRRRFLARIVSSWGRFLNVLIHGERPVEGHSTPATTGGTTAGSMAMRGSPLFESLFADCQGSVMAIRCAALSRQDSSLTDFKMERRGEFPAFMNYLQGFPHGRLQELYEQCDAREAARMPKIIAEVAQVHIERFLSTIYDLLVERDRFRALREIDALLRWYRNWLCPCIDEYAAGNEFITNSLRKAVIPPQRREMQSMLTEAYRFYLLRMYQSTIFAHMIAYEARNLAALRSLFGLGWSQIKEIEETAAAEVWRSAIDEALTTESESEVRARRAGAAFTLPLHEPSTRKRLREMRRFLVAVLGEERAASALALAAKPIVEEEAIRTLVSRRFPDDIEIQRLCILAASLDCDVIDAIRRAGEKLGIGQSTRVKVLVHVASKRMSADLSSLSLRL